MSKILDALEQASHGVSQPMGFAPKAREEKTPPVLLLAAVASDAEAKVAAAAGLDGALVTGARSKTALDKIAKALGSQPWGLWKEEADSAPPEASDFQVFSSEDTPLAAIGGEERASIMQVSPELDDNLLRTIEDLPVDGFLVSLADVDSLTVKQLMRIARVRSVTSKWLLLHLAAVPSKEETERLRELGVSALVIDMAGKAAKDLKSARQALLDLPAEPPRRRQEKRSAIVPSMGLSGTVASPREPGPPPAPDEDDYDYDDV